MSSSGNIQASCICQAVKYEVPAKSLGNVLCHCMHCKKSAGSSYMANAAYKKADLKIRSGQDKLQEYADSNTESGNTINRIFCKDCGSSLFIESVPNKSGTIMISTGAFEYEYAKEWKPSKEIFCKNRLGYLPDIEGTRKKQAML